MLIEETLFDFEADAALSGPGVAIGEGIRLSTRAPCKVLGLR